MKPNLMNNNGYISDDELIRYKINTKYNASKSQTKLFKTRRLTAQDENVRYKLRTNATKTKPEKKIKTKPKIKVNFWGNKQSRIHNTKKENINSDQKHNPVPSTSRNSVPHKPKKLTIKLQKQVSFLPSPVFSANQVPMVTVPDDLTIHLNEEEAKYLQDDLNVVNINCSRNRTRKKIKTPSMRTTRKQSLHNVVETTTNENDLESFSKYVVDQLKQMEQSQRECCENIINSVLKLGLSGKLKNKSDNSDE